jgi:hypothetical protein
MAAAVRALVWALGDFILGPTPELPIDSQKNNPRPTPMRYLLDSHIVIALSKPSSFC